MAALAQRDDIADQTAQTFSLSLTGLSFPIRLQFATPMTDEKLLEFSAQNDIFRMERNARGEIEIRTPTGGEGSRWEAYVVYALTAWTESHGGICFSSNGGFTLPDGSMLSPDASWVAEERWNALSAEERQSFPPLSPDFLIEVRSASDRRSVLQAKMHNWIANGARLAWLIDPAQGTVSIYRPGHETEVLQQPEVLEAGDPVAGFTLKMHRFWSR